MYVGNSSGCHNGMHLVLSSFSDIALSLCFAIKSRDRPMHQISHPVVIMHNPWNLEEVDFTCDMQQNMGNVQQNSHGDNSHLSVHQQHWLIHIDLKKKVPLYTYAHMCISIMLVLGTNASACCYRNPISTCYPVLITDIIPKIDYSSNMHLWYEILQYGPLTRHVKLRVAHAPGMPGTFSPPPISKESTR